MQRRRDSWATARAALVVVAIAARQSARAQVSAATGNHGISTNDVDFSVLQINPAAFGVFISPLGAGALMVALDGGPAAPLSSLAWSGDAVFPALALSAPLGANRDLHVSLNAFAPLSPFFTLQGFFPVLLAQFAIVSASAAHSVTVSYSFTCSGYPGACIGATPPVPPSVSALSAFNSTARVFIGATGGDAVSASCAPSLAHPPALNFTLVANNSAASGADCPFEDWGPGDSLRDCELACAEDPNCTTINFDESSGDCVFRICADPARPIVTAAPGYAVYTTTSPKGPFPLLCASATLALPAGGGSKRATLVIGHHDPAGKYAAFYATAADLFAFVVSAQDDLAAQHSAFIAALPQTGNATSDASVRYLLAPPVLLTKGVGALTSTMGYVEMCPRDGYWTTWLHAFMWPQLEADMIREFAAFQCNSSIIACGGSENDGKIPTTVLPLIYRDDNVDVTAYFVLRVGRYLRASGDAALLAEIYTALRRALLYLQRRCTGGNLVPAALEKSQWADWLDVAYMVGRKYAPHFVFVYLEALREGAALAKQVNATADSALFLAAFESGLAFANAPIVIDGEGRAGGGMWNATSGAFQDLWWDGRVANYTLTDQTVGPFFGLVDSNRTASLFRRLSSSGNENAFGMADYFPFLPHVDDPPGVYGNGGTYAWLTCIDATNRMMHGDRAGGERIWSKLTTTMLYRADQPAHHQAYEYLDSNTGAAMGAFPFGGDGACFMVASLGASQWSRGQYHVGGDVRGADDGFELVLRAEALHPSPGLTLLRPLHRASRQSQQSFVRLVFDEELRLSASIVEGAEPLGAQSSGGSDGGTGRHAWVASAAACRVQELRASTEWAVHCEGVEGYAGAVRVRVVVEN